MRHLLLVALFASACDWSLQRMLEQPRCEPDEPSSLFVDRSCNQPRPSGVVAYQAELTSPTTTGIDDAGLPLAEIPVPIDGATLQHGRERFETFCAACHGLLGDGHSQVAENMTLRKPPSLHEPRIRKLADGTVYRVISEGYGLMPSYGKVLAHDERWAVVAYVRVLEDSQDLAFEELPPDIREEALPWLH